MRRIIGTATTPGRWRRRRTARIALATALIVAAPFVGGRDTDGADGLPTAGSAPGGLPMSSAPSPPSGAVSGGLAGGNTQETAAPGTSTNEALRVVPVPLANPGVADVLSPGDLVDLVAVDAAPDAHEPALVARAARVRDTPDGRNGTRSILVEVPESAAATLAATAAGSPLAVIVHG